MSFDIEALSSAIRESASLPLITVGSGGSLSAAHFLANLHQYYAGRIARTVTPLEVVQMPAVLKSSAAAFISASGNNQDICYTFDFAAHQEPLHLLSVCARKESPLSTLAKNYNFASAFNFDLGLKRDGFLATNSLLSFFVLFARAYLEVFAPLEGLPPADDLWSRVYTLEWLSKHTSDLWSRNELIVLYEPSLLAAAIDLESKFTEAALGVTQLADLRNFGHGRHHWLDKHGETSGVISLVTPAYKTLSSRTLSLLPEHIPRAELCFDSSYCVSNIYALLTVFRLTYLAGKHVGIDPGQPGVPDFGRKLYHLGGAYKVAKQHMKRSTRFVAIERKTNQLPKTAFLNQDKLFWEQAYDKFTVKLSNAQIRAVVFDYDGTLCEKEERFDPPQSEVVNQLVRLLESGLHIGIATGRGVSVRNALISVIPRVWWKNIAIGYYNGADCALLSDEMRPNTKEALNVNLDNFYKFFADHPRWKERADITVRPKQLTIEPRHGHVIDELWHITTSKLSRSSDVKAVRSTHSIDILAPGVTKLSVLDSICELFDIGISDILCVGDQGTWPGNDYELLAQPLSLSVDVVSPDPETCWHLAPAGCKGTKATIYYLNALLLPPPGALIAAAKFQGQFE